MSHVCHSTSFLRGAHRCVSSFIIIFMITLISCTAGVPVKGPITENLTEIHQGTVWHSGSGIPSLGMGNQGDFYFNTVTSDVYQLNASGWVLQNNIQGVQGTAGATWFSGAGIPSAALGVNGDRYLNTTTSDVSLKTAGAWAVVGNIRGAAGAAGATWFSGAGVPAAALGVNGDRYLNTTTGDVSLKTAGTWSVVGNIRGTTGMAGATWLSGTGAPAAALGNDGDHYLNSTNGDVYLKTAGVWNLVSNLRGAMGVAGATWLSGAGAPAAGLGVNGDHYLNTTTSDVYLKTAGAWAIVGNFKGATGTAGATWFSGAGAPAAGLGVDGDRYLNTTTGDVSLKTAGTWAVVGNIRGTAGATWFSGAGAPAAGLGVDGDRYLNTTTGDVSLKTAGVWAVVGNIKGVTGTAGATWLSGAGAPAAGLGNNGDHYLNSTNGDVYLKTAGVWNLAGNLRGAMGTAGATWFSGAGAPAAGLGVNGDHYLNTTTSDVYLKTAGAWSVVGNIKGAAGSAGATWFSGAGAPAAGLGVDGDRYLNTTTGDVSLKTAGVWAVVGNIKGTTGTAGATWLSGAGAPGGGLGNNNDHYMNLLNGDVYFKSSGAWNLVGNLRGATGAAGTPGATWFSGAGAPSVGLGIDGDRYLDTGSGDVYLKSAGAWSISGNIKGATGSTGPQGPMGNPGTDGQNGTKWHSGSSVPPDAFGAEGDYFLKSDTTDVYKKSGGTWAYQGFSLNVSLPQPHTGTNIRFTRQSITSNFPDGDKDLACTTEFGPNYGAATLFDVGVNFGTTSGSNAFVVAGNGNALLVFNHAFSTIGLSTASVACVRLDAHFRSTRASIVSNSPNAAKDLLCQDLGNYQAAMLNDVTASTVNVNGIGIFTVANDSSGYTINSSSWSATGLIFTQVACIHN